MRTEVRYLERFTTALTLLPRANKWLLLHVSSVASVVNTVRESENDGQRGEASEMDE